MRKKTVYKLLPGILALSLAAPVTVITPGMDLKVQAEDGQTSRMTERGLEVTGVLATAYGNFSSGSYYVPDSDAVMDFNLNDSETGVILTRAARCSGHVTIPAYVDGYPIVQIGKKKDEYGTQQNGFSYNSDMTAVTIPDTVKDMGEYAFGFCINLREAMIPDSVSSIGNYCFYETGIEKAIFSKSMEIIPVAAFVNCKKIKRMVIPDHIISIGEAAFEGCTGLELITIPSSVNQIDRRAFADCTSLKEIVIPKGVTRIADNTFDGCTSLRSISISSTVTSISSFAFGNDNSGAASLKEVKYNGTKEQWDAISIGSGAKKAIKENAAVFCADGTKIVNGAVASGENISSSGSSVKIGDTIMKNKVKYKVTSVSGGNRNVSVSGVSSRTLTSTSIPGAVTIGGQTYKVTAIADSAFNGCRKLKTVTVGSNVKSIGNKAFYNCTSLKTVKGCSSVTSIGTAAFYKCEKLVTVGSKNNVISFSKVKTIASNAFNGCKAIKKVNLTSAALTKINDSAFAGCTGMAGFTASSTKLFSIGKNAFKGDRKLSFITLKTSKLKVSSVGKNAFKGIKSTCTMKVPSGKTAAYKKIFKVRGAGKRIVVKKL